MYVKTFVAASPGLIQPACPVERPSTRSPSCDRGGRVRERDAAHPRICHPGSRPTSPRSSHRSVPAEAGLLEATTAARELTLLTIELTLRSGRCDSGEASLEMAAELRCATAGVALGLETRTAPALLAALHSLWRASDLVDQAERAGLLDVEEAVELLVLGSRVEIPLVRFLRRCGFERSLQPPRPCRGEGATAAVTETALPS